MPMTQIDMDEAILNGEQKAQDWLEQIDNDWRDATRKVIRQAVIRKLERMLPKVRTNGPQELQPRD